MNFFKQNNKLYNLIRKVYHYRLWKPKEIKKLGKILELYNNYKSGNVSFVQIGSNDGLNGDPIYELVRRNQWRGILVEPMPEIFEQLKNNYREYSSNLIFENIAIAGDGNGLSEFYSVRNDDGALPAWVNQLGSFEKHVILKHVDYFPEINDRITVTKIRTDRFENMIQRNKVEHIDLIHIDTEGYDYEILKQINFDKYQPEIILYEHKHLENRVYKSSLRLLKEKGYKLFIHQGDTLAVQHKLLSKIIFN